MLTKLIAALALCLALAITPLTASPAHARADVKGRAGESRAGSAFPVTVGRAALPR